MNLRTQVTADDLAAVRQWFDTLSQHCRTVDYEGARPIFADDMIAFGTFTDFMIGRELAEEKQWRNVWGTIREFRYDLSKIEAIVSADRLTAVGIDKAERGKTEPSDHVPVWCELDVAA